MTKFNNDLPDELSYNLKMLFCFHGFRASLNFELSEDFEFFS
ncbi:MAG: hypothetical protein ABFS56_12605 [Pseudomonadota bacterium]